MIRFAFLDKREKVQYAQRLFNLLYANMSVIAPTGYTYQEDFAAWSAAVLPALDKPQRQIVCIYDDEAFIGYFQYYVNDDLFMMEEIQFLRSYQSEKQLFRRLYTFLLPQLPAGICFVEAYANKKNIKSQEILKHLGLSVTKENETNLLYRGNYMDLVNWCTKEKIN